MSAPLTLRGITWDHDRGYQPLLATAAAYAQQAPGVRVAWEKRSLKEFEETPVEHLAPTYDLLVIDHPFVGVAAQAHILLPLDGELPAEFLANQAANSVGASHASYAYGGRQWALAIDAAAPVASWEPEALAAAGFAPPRSWPEVEAAGRAGLLEVPAAPINCLMNFYMLCADAGERPFSGPGVVGRPAGRAALERLRSLLRWCDPGVWDRNPIASYARLAGGETRAAYCPFAYGYSNYTRPGGAGRRLVFGDLPAGGHGPLVSTLGGTGLAVSARRPHAAAALAYAQYVASGEVQRTLYARSGGQPGHRSAWLDAENNRLTGGYFSATLPALDRASVRPRYAGYLEFQIAAGPVVQQALRGLMRDDDALQTLDALHRHSLAAGAARP